MRHPRAQTHPKTQPKAIPWSSSRKWRTLKANDVVGKHVLDGLTRQNAHAVKLASVQHHLGKAEEVLCRRDGACAPEPVALAWVILHAGPLPETRLLRISIECVSQTTALFWRHLEAGVLHLQRLEDDLVHELVKPL